MIDIVKKESCCGCQACMSVCPQQCINMIPDREGFWYPIVNKNKCVECGLCNKVCPELNTRKNRYPVKIYATQYKDNKIRENSASGGYFTYLSELVLNQGGVVFGAIFDENWDVRHSYTESLEDLYLFRGSKYVQSYIGDSFQKAKEFLDNGRIVLFSGTPCQIYALKLFLRKKYDNLIAVDIVCHGVPSPKIWQFYLFDVLKNSPSGLRSPVISSINFRDKTSGWNDFSLLFTISGYNDKGNKESIKYSEKFKENPYMQAFLSDISLRPSCYRCPAKCGKSGSDITIGDFWGIKKILPDMDDDKGTSLVLIYNDKYRPQTELCRVKETNYDSAVRSNYALERSVHKPLYRLWYLSKTICLNKFIKPGNNSRIIHIVERLYKKIKLCISH